MWKRLSLFLLLCSYAYSQDASQLQLQEMSLWTKLEYNMLSTQNELNGLRNLVSQLQADSEKQTLELKTSLIVREQLSKQLESTASSFSSLLTDYNKLKIKEQKLIKNLVITIAILALLVLNWLIDMTFWISHKRFLWWG